MTRALLESESVEFGDGNTSNVLKETHQNSKEDLNQGLSSVEKCPRAISGPFLFMKSNEIWQEMSNPDNFRMEISPKFSLSYMYRAARWYVRKPHVFSYVLGWGVFAAMVYSIPITEDMRKTSKFENYDAVMTKHMEESKHH